MKKSQPIRRDVLRTLFVATAGAVVAAGFPNQNHAAVAQPFFRGARIPADLAGRMKLQGETASAVLGALSADTRFLQMSRSGFPRLFDTRREALPKSWDWRRDKRVTPVKQQGSCGSCWIFAAIASYESAYAIANQIDAVNLNGQPTFRVSEQQVLDCGFVESDCRGGWHEEALLYLRTRGVTTADAYPYEANKAQCNTAVPRTYRALTWGYLPADISLPIPTDENLKWFVRYYGPVACAVATRGWDSYRKYYSDGTFNPAWYSNFPSGVFEGEPTPNFKVNDIDHCVVIVGWDDDEGVWLVKNSWGPFWGDGGIMKLRYRRNCIGYGATWVMAYPANAVSEELERRLEDIERSSEFRRRYYPAA
jgi:cathepsin L